MSEVGIDANRVIEKLGRRIGDLEVQIAQQAAVITVLLEERDGQDKVDGAAEASE